VSRAISYRLSLVVAIPFLIVLTSAILGSTSYVTTRKSVDALTRQLFDQVSTQAAEETRAHVLQAEPAVDLLVASISQMTDRGDITNDDALAVELVDVLRANAGFEWATFGDEHGSLVGAQRQGTEIRLDKSFIENGKTIALDSTVNADGTHTPDVRTENDYDPRKRPYYELAKKHHGRVWTPPYIFFNEGAPGITCAAPVYAKDGALRGVVTVDFGLEILSEFVRGLHLSPHAVVFLETDDGTILAHPTLHVVAKTGAGTQGELVTRKSASDPILAALFAASPPNDARERFSFSVGDARWIGSERPFAIDEGLHWSVAAAAPESDFDGPLQSILRSALVVSILAVLVAVALGAGLARLIARPLARVAMEMDRVGNFEIDERGRPSASVFVEINAINRALHAMKGGLRSFAAYVPRDLVRAVLASGTRAELGGKTKPLTIFFSDLAGFTTLSETMKPDALVELLGGYFDEMTRVIQKRGGTIDKFIGDAIMAFWNAPGDAPEHAALACEAALACQKKLDEMRKKDPRLANLHARIGLATGDVLVGNIGASDRMNYTVMGDTANLASRLEGLNKAYGTPVMIAQSTFEAAKSAIVARPIDVVAVKGKVTGVRVYEPIALAKDATDDEKKFAAACTRALDAYLARDFSNAAKAWDDALAIRKDDEACATMKSRALDYAKSPPPAEWNGAHVMHEK
jgi:adenylate cyclase